MSASASGLETAATPHYALRSEIAMACLPQSQSDPGRKVMWVNAVCAFFLTAGVIGIKAPLDAVLRVAMMEETTLIPVEFQPPPVPDMPTPEDLSQLPREELAPQDLPQVVQPVAVVADPASVPFAVEVKGPTITARTPAQASPPPPRPVAQLPPPAPVQNTGPRTFRAGDGTGEGIFAPHPDYPADALRKGIEGTVKLEIEVNEDGSIGEVRRLIPSGSFVLDNNTITWVKKRWKFPAGNKQVLHTEFVYQLAGRR